MICDDMWIINGRDKKKKKNIIRHVFLLCLVLNLDPNRLHTGNEVTSVLFAGVKLYMS